MESFFKPFAFIKENRHKKLPDDLGLSTEPVKEGVVFSATYLGNTIIESYKTENYSIKAVKSIIKMSKLSGKKIRVNLFITPKGIKSTNLENKDLFQEFSIFRIASCVSISMYGKIFAFIFRNSINEILECHGFQCDKKKIALALTRSVVHSFNLANELYEAKRGSVAEKKHTHLLENKQNEETSKKGFSHLAHNPLPCFERMQSLTNLDVPDKILNPIFIPTLNSCRSSMSRSSKWHQGFGFDDNFTSKHIPTIDDLLC